MSTVLKTPPETGNQQYRKSWALHEHGYAGWAGTISLLTERESKGGPYAMNVFRRSDLKNVFFPISTSSKHIFLVLKSRQKIAVQHALKKNSELRKIRQQKLWNSRDTEIQQDVNNTNKNNPNMVEPSITVDLFIALCRGFPDNPIGRVKAAPKPYKPTPLLQVTNIRYTLFIYTYITV